MQRKIFKMSMLLNVIFALGYAWLWINSPTYEVGVLEEDIEVVYPFSKDRIFTIPKGLTVKNRSARGLNGIGQLENHRFSIIITSNDPTLVNYGSEKANMLTFEYLYSGFKASKDEN